MKYALIGCGRISVNHIQAALNNNLEIVGICDFLFWFVVFEKYTKKFIIIRCNFQRKIDCSNGLYFVEHCVTYSNNVGI